MMPNIDAEPSLSSSSLRGWLLLALVGGLILLSSASTAAGPAAVGLGALLLSVGLFWPARSPRVPAFGLVVGVLVFGLSRLDPAPGNAVIVGAVMAAVSGLSLLRWWDRRRR